MKVAVITGAASGIGLALSQVYLSKDAILVMVDKDQDKLNHEVRQLSTQYSDKILGITCDITKNNQVQDLAQKVSENFGRVDLLYNNAGIIGPLAPVWELSIPDLQQVMEVNLYGMINMIQAFCPLLFTQEHDSHIINMASLYALCAGSQVAAYSMSKHAVLSLSESLYYDLKSLEKAIDVSVVFPSFTDTGLLSSSKDGQSATHTRLQHLLTHARPALDVAKNIALEVENKKFYILPDKEVKDYCEKRTNSILLQEQPHINNIEKLMTSLRNRECPS